VSTAHLASRPRRPRLPPPQASYQEAAALRRQDELIAEEEEEERSESLRQLQKSLADKEKRLKKKVGARGRWLAGWQARPEQAAARRVQLARLARLVQLASRQPREQGASSHGALPRRAPCAVRLQERQRQKKAADQQRREAEEEERRRQQEEQRRREQQQAAERRRCVPGAPAERSCRAGISKCWIAAAAKCSWRAYALHPRSCCGRGPGCSCC
jgi:colicin import membrane protein